MNTQIFNIYGYCIKILSSDFSLSELKVNSDFEFFSSAVAENPDLQIVVKKLTEVRLRGFPIGKTSMCEVRQVSLQLRQLVYRKHEKILAVVNDSSDSKNRLVEINAADNAIIDDVLYFLINSCCGEYLDKKGLMRIHALSYSTKNRGAVVFGFPGAGKSTVALGLMKNAGVRIFSDEISIYDINKRVMLPFPIRIAVTDISEKAGFATKFTYFFNTKYLVNLEKDKISTSCKLTHFHFLDRSRKPVLFYLISILLGIGLIQMWEYLLRFNNIPALFRIAKNRLKLCRILLLYKPSFLDRNLLLEEKLKILL